MSSAADTLFLPFEKGEVAWPQEEERWLWLNAQVPDEGIDRDLLPHLVCEQTFRPDVLDLQSRGIEATNKALGTAYSGALILLGKHRGENEEMVRRASQRLAPGATIIMAGDKQSGIAPLRKRLSQDVEIIDTLAKHHATAVVFVNTKAITDILQHPDSILVEGRFQTQPGMFSHDHVDPASKLLAEHITPKRIKGGVADFGAGWGYLGAAVLEKGAAESLSLFEAHWPSLQVAMSNLQPLAGADVALSAHWIDLVREGPSRRFDAIVMNPPFHRGAKSDSDIGKAFIRAASAALRPNGVLLMVANVKLPYEETLAASFRRVTELEKRDGFKLFEAVR